MNAWIVRHEHYWALLSYAGDVLSIHGFMCSCKAHAMALHLPFCIISDRSSPSDIDRFFNIT